MHILLNRHQYFWDSVLMYSALTKAGGYICVQSLPGATGDASQLTHSSTCQEAKEITRRDPPIEITYIGKDPPNRNYI